MRFAILAALALAGCSQATEKEPEQKLIAGRYRIVVAEGRTFRIDTATGETWKLMHIGSPGDEATDWLPVTNTTLSDWVKFKEEVDKPPPLPPGYKLDPPKVGHVEDGYRFKGGDPSKKGKLGEADLTPNPRDFQRGEK